MISISLLNLQQLRKMLLLSLQVPCKCYQLGNLWSPSPTIQCCPNLISSRWTFPKINVWHLLYDNSISYSSLLCDTLLCLQIPDKSCLRPGNIVQKTLQSPLSPELTRCVQVDLVSWSSHMKFDPVANDSYQTSLVIQWLGTYQCWGRRFSLWFGKIPHILGWLSWQKPQQLSHKILEPLYHQ